MLILLASLALADPSPLDPSPARPVCLTADEVRTRILEPLSALVRCQDEVAILEAERGDMHDALTQVAAEVNDERIARRAAEARVKRARRGQAVAGGSGAGATDA